MTGAIHKTSLPTIGRLELRPLRLPDEAALIHDWVRRPYARFWAMGDKSLAEIAAFYAAMDASEHEAALMGLHEGRPAFLVETYDPAHHELADHYPVHRGDHGMHVLLAPAITPIPGFSRAVFKAVMDHLFADPAVQRVVVEPDVRNAKIQALNALFGFVTARTIWLADKEAALSFCSRDAYAAALAAPVPA